MTIAAKTPMKDDTLKWQPTPSLIEKTALFRFMQLINTQYQLNCATYADLWTWSVENPASFWSEIWDFCGVIGDKGAAPFLLQAEKMQDCRFFPQASLNFAENLLQRRDQAPAIIMRGEHGLEREMSWHDLYQTVSRLRQFLVAQGVGKGDRVAGYLPNIDLSVAAMLAAASLGAIWSSASPDFGVQGVLDRFGQIEPKVLFAVNGYSYGGKKINCLDKLAEIIPSLPSLKSCVVIDYVDAGGEMDKLPKALALNQALALYQAQEIAFERFEFNHPLYIMFSSGTTGIPKCIVHGAGGTLLQHLKEHQLQSNIKRDDRVFYFTTLGWMMWNWQVSALATGATLMLFDGSPFYPSAPMLFQYAEKYGCSFFGTSAKYIDSLKSIKARPCDKADLSKIQTLASTGSPLVHESFDYIYDAISPHLHVASISGGTDIVSCFVLGNPISPVYRGEIQGAGLGMDVDIFDENGQSLKTGKGELVCKTPFPSMPIKFWHDDAGQKYHAAYFERFANIWCHGDWCERTPHGGFIIHGRSDATLNPGGVRIGTAEIYRQVEKLNAIKESIAVGQDFDGDVRVILFVTLKEGHHLDDALKTEIKKVIKEGASPRHVPAKIIAVSDIPRTKSGKITELAVREIIHGRAVKNVEALANPEALAYYQNLDELKTK